MEDESDSDESEEEEDNNDNDDGADDSDEDKSEEDAEEEREEAVDENFRMELMKVLQTTNAIVSFDVGKLTSYKFDFVDCFISINQQGLSNWNQILNTQLF